VIWERNGSKQLYLFQANVIAYVCKNYETLLNTSMKITDLVKDCTGDYKYETGLLKIYTTMFSIAENLR
jgi:hypothetical protein